MTGRWFTRTAVATQLGIERDHVEDLIGAGLLHLGSIAGDHEVIGERSVQEFERDYPPPMWTPWTAADDPEAHLDRSDYTPIDEGDEQQ